MSEALPLAQQLVGDLLWAASHLKLNHHVIEVDFSAVERFRRDCRDSHGESPSYVLCTLFAISRTLTNHPKLNSFLGGWFYGSRLTTYRSVDICLTVEKTDNISREVFLEVIRDSRSLSLNQFIAYFKMIRSRSLRDYQRMSPSAYCYRIPRPIRRLAIRCMTRSARLSRTFLGTCGFTTVGRFGTDISFPLSPKTLTFSLGRVASRPMVRDGLLAVGLTAYVTITYDHRVTNGAEVATMGNELRQYLEQFGDRVLDEGRR